jgi:GDPmannose 4,6-dehydratase
MLPTCHLYGITRTVKEYNKNILKFECDVTDRTTLEKIIDILSPEAIVHLAGISSSEMAQQMPVETIEINGMATTYICESIHKLKLNTKLFHASSSEIYKGHVTYTIKEDDTNYFHLHPYSMAKILGHSFVDMYRKNYGYAFSNGILFMTESQKRKGNFIVSKVAEHASKWKETKEVLQLGNLDSFRNFIHASDVANAIFYILEQEKGDTYVVCNTSRILVKELVEGIYKKFGIHMYKKENTYYEKESNMEVLHVGESIRGVQTDIDGECKKLYGLGWSIKYTIDDILQDIRNGYP